MESLVHQVWPLCVPEWKNPLRLPMAEIGKKHIVGGIGGVSGAVAIFAFTYFVTKDSHMEDVHRVEQKTDGNVPSWIYYPEVKEMKAEIMALRERIAKLEK
jgi:hypothetical protein